MKLKDSIKLKWVRGNDVALKVTVCEPQYNEAGEPVKDANGNIVWKAVDLDSYDDITVTIRVMPGSEGTSSCNCNCKDKENPSSYIVSSSKSSEEGILIVDIPGTLPNGDYAMEFTGHKNGRAVRALEGMMFGIVECSGKANVTFDVQEGVRSCDLDLKIQMVPSSLVRGKNAYELWKEIPGNEGKTLQDYLDSIGTDAIKALQSDWNETDPNSSAYIRNKPTSMSMEVDSELSSTSVRPVQNKVVQAGLIGILQSVRDSYYPKDRLYTKEEVNTLIDSSSKIRTTIVDALPEASAYTMGRIYIVPSQSPTEGNVKTEYITIENDGTYSWEQLGGEGSGSIDPDIYPTIEQMQTAIANAISDSIEDVTYHGEDTGSAASADFNPQSDTVWTTPQILSETQKTIARNNIDVPSVNMVNSAMANKQDKLVSGITLKTVGGVSLLGEGNIPLPSGGSDSGGVISTLDDVPDGTVRKLSDYATKVQVILKADNDKVVHTTGNEIVAGIKEFDDQINLNDDLQHGSATDYSWIKNASDDTLQDKLDAKQDVLVSGQNIKKINGYDITGSGNLIIPTGSGSTAVDNEDIEVNQEGKLALKDRVTEYSSKNYVRVRKNLKSVQVQKTDYENVVWVHGVEENVLRTTSGVTSSDEYDPNTKYYVGNATPHYGHHSGFPQSGTSESDSIREAAPYIMLNTTNNAVFFRWQWYAGSWGYKDIWYDGWGENPYADNHYAIIPGTPKTFAYVKYGKTYYYHWNGSSWEKKVKEIKLINTIPDELINSDNTFGAEDTIYEIMYDIDLNGSTLKPAKGVVLKYGGGKIKNGAINFVNANNGAIIIDCPDVQFFENITIMKSFSQVLKDVWFDDIWMSLTPDPNVCEFSCTAISLSKNHKIDFKHGPILARDVITRKFTIYGNGNTLTINNSYKFSGDLLFDCRNIIIYDLKIVLSNTDIHTYDTIFYGVNVFMRNVSYKGYSRLVVNNSNNIMHYSLSGLELHDCDLRSTAFLFEGQFNKVRFYNSKLRYINPIVRELYELISIGSSALNTAVENCSVEAYDTYIGGVWELTPGTGLDSNGNILPNTQDDSWVSTYGYSYMKFHNCELVRFTTDNGSEKRGNTNVIYEDCHFKICNMPWRGSCISTVTYKNCWIDIFSDKVGTNIGAFNFWNIKSARFEGCTLRNTSFTDPEVTMKGGTYYPQGYTYPPMRSNPIISIVPPRSVVGTTEVDSAHNVALTSDWDFKLYLYGNRIIVNDELLVETIDGELRESHPYSRFRILVVTPRDTSKKVILTDAQAKSLVVSKGNAFVHSIHGISGYLQANGSVGCSAYLNNRRNIIPVDNTVFTAYVPATAAPDIDYIHAYFGYCGTNFTFIDASEDIPRYGRYNAATETVAWVTYSEEEVMPEQNIPGNP